MTTSQLITALEQALRKHGDLPVRFQFAGAEQRFGEIVFTEKGTSFHHGSIQGAPQFEPDRLVIKCGN